MMEPMSWWITAAALCLIIFSIPVQSLQKRCSSVPGQTDQLLIEIRVADDASAKQILAYGPQYEQGCKSSVTTVVNGFGSSDIHSLDIVYDYVVPEQLQPDPNTDECYVMQGGTITVYGLTVVVQQQQGVIQVSDKFYIVLCDTDDLDAGFADVTPTDVSLNDISPTLAPDQSEAFNIQLMNTDDIATTSVQLGETVYLMMTYTRPSTAVGEWPIGVHNYQVTVHYDWNQPGEVTLIDAFGCVNDDVNALPFGLSTTFFWSGSNAGSTQYFFRTVFACCLVKYADNRLANVAGDVRPSVVDEDHDFYVVDWVLYDRLANVSGDFTIAMLEGGNTLLFRGFYIAQCYSTDNDFCFDQDSYCSGGLIGRRKRSVGAAEVNGTYDLTVTVDVPDTRDQDNADGTDESKQCTADTMLWILSLVLAALLLLVTGTLILLYSRMRNERRRTDEHHIHRKHLPPQHHTPSYMKY